MDSSFSAFGHAHCCPKGDSCKSRTKMANIVDPDEMAHSELSHLDLHCLQKHRSWPTGITKTHLFKYIENFTTKKRKIFRYLN